MKLVLKLMMVYPVLYRVRMYIVHREKNKSQFWSSVLRASNSKRQNYIEKTQITGRSSFDTHYVLKLRRVTRRTTHIIILVGAHCQFALNHMFTSHSYCVNKRLKDQSSDN